MDSFSILTNRKRAIIAALQIALSHAAAFSLHSDNVVGGVVLLTIYTIVTTVLLVLLNMADCATEKLYFALCTISAGLGFLRILLGDPVLHAGVLRVLLLSCAVVVGTFILRTHSMTPVGEEMEQQ